MLLTLDGNKKVSRVTVSLASAKSLICLVCCCIIVQVIAQKHAFGQFCASRLQRCQHLVHTEIHWPFIHGSVHHVNLGALYSHKPTCTMRDHDKVFRYNTPLASSLNGATNNSFANAFNLGSSCFVYWEWVILRYNILRLFSLLILHFFFLRFCVDVKRAFMSSGTTWDLSSSPELRRYLLLTQSSSEWWVLTHEWHRWTCNSLRITHECLWKRCENSWINEW